jgi:phosphoribosylformylglycinamidine cyclo-ligase
LVNGNSHRATQRADYYQLPFTNDLSVSLPTSTEPPMTNLYRQSGVDIDAGNRAVALMKDAVRATHTTQVLADVGSFGGLFALEDLPAQPVLVASTDGVGTKVKLAAQHGRWEGIGRDIVNHCINDILVQNARPLFFLDYIASSRLVPEEVAAVVMGMAQACKAAGCALLGGETAEMPGVYAEGAFDVAGTVVGLLNRAELLPQSQNMAAGDLLVGLPSSGPHTNGYSLIRRVVEERDLLQPLADGQTLLDALLEPHRCYLPEAIALRAAGVPLLGMAHITGGGFVENLPRVLPEHLAARVELSAWPLPPLFARLIEWSGLSVAEACRVLNLGIGMVLIASPAALPALQRTLPEAIVMGLLTPRTSEAVILNGAFS